jgi:hypothetical protein
VVITKTIPNLCKSRFAVLRWVNMLCLRELCTPTLAVVRGKAPPLHLPLLSPSQVAQVFDEIADLIMYTCNCGLNSLRVINDEYKGDKL